MEPHPAQQGWGLPLLGSRPFQPKSVASASASPTRWLLHDSLVPPICAAHLALRLNGLLATQFTDKGLEDHGAIAQAKVDGVKILLFEESKVASPQVSCS